MRSTFAVFGGSFDPPHVGHVLAVTYVLSAFALDGVLVIPVHRHAFGKDLVSFEDRFAMCEAAMGWIPRVVISDVERRLGGESRTLHTLEALLAEAPERDLRLVIGSDVLPDLPKWYRFDRIRELASPIILGRAGHPHPDAPVAVLPEVSSTAIREAYRRGPAAGDRLDTLVPTTVRQHIREHGLYAAPTEPR